MMISKIVRLTEKKKKQAGHKMYFVLPATAARNTAFTPRYIRRAFWFN
jgi:hypothetical protein